MDGACRQANRAERGREIISGPRSRLLRRRAFARRLDKLDEDFPSLHRRKKEIYARSIGAGARGRINGLEAESCAESVRRAIHVAHADFNLLDAFAELSQIA